MQYEKYPYPVIEVKETGKRIEFYMKQKNISAKQLQEYLGLSCVQSIYRWINGINLPSVDHLYAMSGLFQIPVDEMICGSRQPVNTAHVRREYQRFIVYCRRYIEYHAAG